MGWEEIEKKERAEQRAERWGRIRESKGNRWYRVVKGEGIPEYLQKGWGRVGGGG